MLEKPIRCSYLIYFSRQTMYFIRFKSGLDRLWRSSWSLSANPLNPLWKEWISIRLKFVRLKSKVVAISLLVAKFIEVGKSRAMKVTSFLKRVSSSFKNSSVFGLYRSIHSRIWHWNILLATAEKIFDYLIPPYFINPYPNKCRFRVYPRWTVWDGEPMSW